MQGLGDLLNKIFIILFSSMYRTHLHSGHFPLTSHKGCEAKMLGCCYAAVFLT